MVSLAPLSPIAVGALAVESLESSCGVLTRLQWALMRLDTITLAGQPPPRALQPTAPNQYRNQEIR